MTDADAGVVDAGTDTGSVADAGSTDAGTDSDGGLVDTGGQSDGGQTDAGMTAGWHCLDGGQVQVDCSPAPPAQSTVCRPPLHPLSPVVPAFDGGIPGPCTETLFNGNTQYDKSWTYDSAGNILTETQTQDSNVSRLTNIWDSCGRNVYTETRSLDGGLLTATESDYGSDGLLLRTVSSPWCEQRFAYVLDDAGQVVTVYDPVACTLIERIERDAGTLAAIRTNGRTTWDLLPDGGVLRVSNSSAYGFWGESVWDEQGRPLSEDSTGSASSITISATWRRDGGQLLRYARSSQGNGCSTDSWFTEAFVYDGGTLVHEDLAQSGDPCNWGNGSDTAWTIDYVYPSDGVQLAQTTADGGVTELRKTVFDERGNALSVDQASAPDFTWQPQLRRTYGCLGDE